MIYIADKYFTGGNGLVTQPYQVFLPYLNLWDDFIYVSARTGAHSYSIPMPNGYYVVEFRLAEIEDKKKGERVFNIVLQVRGTCCRCWSEYESTEGILGVRGVLPRPKTVCFALL